MGRRRPFMLVALGPMGFCVALVAFMPSFWTMTLVLLAFFFAYSSTSRRIEGSIRTCSTGRPTVARRGSTTSCAAPRSRAGLVGGGFLLDVWHPFPFWSPRS